jgi:hypothetical protein
VGTAMRRGTPGIELEPAAILGAGAPIRRQQRL